MYCTGNNIYDKQVQGGSVLIIEPGTLCVFQKPKSVVCEVLKEGKIKIPLKTFLSKVANFFFFGIIFNNSFNSDDFFPPEKYYVSARFRWSQPHFYTQIAAKLPCIWVFYNGANPI